MKKIRFYKQLIETIKFILFAFFNFSTFPTLTKNHIAYHLRHSDVYYQLAAAEKAVCG